MNNTLQDKITSIVTAAAEEILRTIRDSSFTEVFNYPAARASPVQTPKKIAASVSGKRIRRSAAELAKVTASIVTVLKQHPKGLRMEQIRSKLGLDYKDVFGPVAQALAAKTIRKKGERRATTYYAK